MTRWYFSLLLSVLILAAVVPTLSQDSIMGFTPASAARQLDGGPFFNTECKFFHLSFTLLLLPTVG